MMRLHAAAIVLALLFLGGCGDSAGTWIGDVAGDSARAESAEERGDPTEARAALERLLERDVPDDVAEDDARVVRQDAHERLARLLFEAGDPERARVEVESGLALGERQDVFTANLLTLRGQIREAAGEDRGAAEDYHRALRIHDALLDRVLGR